MHPRPSRAAGAALSLLAACVAPRARPELPRGQLEALIDARASAGSSGAAFRPGGVALVARGDQLLSRAYGMADVDARTPVRLDTRFKVGSITKCFTAAAVLRLVQAGRLALDDDVREHVPDAPTGGRAVTIDQLLTHTGGLANLVDRPDFEELLGRDHDLRELLDLTREHPLVGQPGTLFHYSDSGYMLLAAVIEAVSAGPWAECLEREVLLPLGLRDTFVGDDAFEPPRMARGYSLEGGVVAPAAPFSMSVPHAAGALVSTAADLVAFERGLRSGELLSPELLERAWSPRRLPDGTRVGYGYGWKLCFIEGKRSIEHGGWVPGFSSCLLRLPDEDITVVVLRNVDSDPDAGHLARSLVRLLLTGSPEPTRIELGEARSAALTGSYRTASGSEWQVLAGEDGLWIQLGSQEPWRAWALSATELTPAGGDASYVLEFDLGAGGRAEAVASRLSCEPVEHASRVPDLGE